MRIDFVSDIACPWCAIGFNALERALERFGGELGEIQLEIQPFELNPDMPPEGADLTEYLTAKLGTDLTRLEATQQRIAERGAEEGFTFGERSRIWNTFNAHRLLYWAGAEGAPGTQRALKRALLTAYHGQGRNPGADDVLLELAEQVGLPVERAREVLERGEYAQEVRAAERFWHEAGINSVPAVIINRQHLISGGQPNAVFEQALREIAGEAREAASQPG